MAIDSTRLQRHVQLEALRNVREVGGYTGRAGQIVRWHRLYRADDLSCATTADLAALGALGIRTVVDLRSVGEVRLRPAPSIPGADRRHVPLLRDAWRPRATSFDPRIDPADALVERYVEMLVEGAPAVSEALALLASPASYPVLFHSALGKDRTGVLIAVVLGLLAVHDESIVDDYAESATLLDGGPAPASPTAPGLAARSVLDDPGLDALRAVGSPPEAMIRFLERIRDRARSMVGFARSIGVPFEAVESLHNNLLS